MKVEVSERDMELIVRGLQLLRDHIAARGQWRLPAEVGVLLERLKPQPSARPRVLVEEEPAGALPLERKRIS